MGMSNTVVRRKSDGKFRKVIRRRGVAVATWHRDPNQAKVYANSLGALLSAPGIRKVVRDDSGTYPRWAYVGTELEDDMEIVEIRVCSVTI